LNLQLVNIKKGSGRPQLRAKEFWGEVKKIEEREERIKQLEAQLICNIKIA